MNKPKRTAITTILTPEKREALKTAIIEREGSHYGNLDKVMSDLIDYYIEHGRPFFRTSGGIELPLTYDIVKELLFSKIIQKNLENELDSIKFFFENKSPSSFKKWKSQHEKTLLDSSALPEYY